jgi:hypothetical protein
VVAAALSEELHPLAKELPIQQDQELSGVSCQSSSCKAEGHQRT